MHFFLYFLSPSKSKKSPSQGGLSWGLRYYQIFLNELNNYSFNIGFFNINSIEIPNQLEITIKGKNYKLKEICSTDLPFIKAFGIINCNKAILINKKQEIFQNISI